MSYLAEQEIICAFCQHPFHAEIWSSINVQEDPELRDVLLGGELNMIECEACHNIFYSEHFLLYHDPVNELMVFVYPRSHHLEKEKWEEKTKADFLETQKTALDRDSITYEPTTVFGLDELVAIVEKEEEASIQGEIVTHLAKEHGFKVRPIRPSVARGKKLPKIIPYIPDSKLSVREAVLNALTVIEKVNDRLSVYVDARRLLMENPRISPDGE